MLMFFETFVTIILICNFRLLLVACSSNRSEGDSVGRRLTKRELNRASTPPPTHLKSKWASVRKNDEDIYHGLTFEKTSSPPRKPNPYIAICFCGQFWRNAILSRPISSLFPGVPEAKFYAFIAMSEQNSELNDGHELINGSALCYRASDLGFEDCFHELRPYVASVFVDATHHLGFKGSSLFPHRTASYFSTISRALSMVSTSSTDFDQVIVTRADIYDKIQANKDGSWYQRGQWNIIGHGTNIIAIDDRIIIGDTKFMMPLVHLYSRFLKSKSSQGLDLIPEIEVFRFFKSLPEWAGLPAPLIGLRDNFVKVSMFHFQQEKYDADFGDKLLSAMRTTIGTVKNIEIRNERQHISRSNLHLRQLAKVSFPLAHLCSGLSKDLVADTVAMSGGRKSTYFEKLRGITPAMGSSEIHLTNRSLRAVFIGDNVVQELAVSHGRLNYGVDSFEFHLVEHWERQRLNTTTSSGVQISGQYIPKLSTFQKNVRSAEHNFVFIGGLGLSYLVRSNGPMPAHSGDDPVILHRTLIRQHLLEFQAFAKMTGVHVVFVGTLPPDEATLGMVPSKHDFSNHFDFSLAFVWDSLEAEEFMTLKNKGILDMVHYLRLADLARKCPGIRCDGLLFGSQATSEGCYSNSALLDGFLASFLISVHSSDNLHEVPLRVTLHNLSSTTINFDEVHPRKLKSKRIKKRMKTAMTLPSAPAFQLTSLNANKYWPPIKCELLSEDVVAGAVAMSGGRRSSFFNELRKYTGLTKAAYKISGVKLAFSSRAAFIGDSIMRELALAFGRVVSDGSNSPSFDLINQHTWERVQPTSTLDVAPTFKSLEKLLEVLELENRKKYGAIFVGGLGMHYLVRRYPYQKSGKSGPMPLQEGDEPVELHRDLIRRHLVDIAAYSKTKKIPVVFVGILPLDAATIGMAPAKHDFLDFFDFSLSSLWDSVEAEEYGKLKDEGILGDMVYHLRLADLARQCPGVRCDGMHFGSSFEDFGCESSEALWDSFIADFLTTTFPSTNRANAVTSSSPEYASAAEQCKISSGRLRLPTENIKGCGQNTKVAVLLVGTSAISTTLLELHMQNMLESILMPHQADVFAVTDDAAGSIFKGLMLVEALPAYLGGHLKGFGVVMSVLPLFSVDKSEFTEYIIARYRAPEVERAHLQWHKLHKAWTLMTEHESKAGVTYDYVLKLRFDATPIGILNICGNSRASATLDGSFRAIFACTDMVFWGTRSAMEVAAFGTWTAILNYFEGERSNSMSRSFFVIPFLESLLATPQTFWRQPMLLDPWKLYNKPGTLPYIDMGKGSASVNQGGYEKMIENLKLARDNGLDFVDPILLSNNYTFLKGAHASAFDNRNSFVSEKDFLGWLILNNITVCDLGADSYAMLFKGEVICRPSLSCTRH